MSTVVTSQTSWFSSIVKALLGFVIAPLVGLCAAFLLFWNEGDYLYIAYSLDEGEQVVKSIDPHQIDPALEGKLVHVSGHLKVPHQVEDPQFGLKVTAIRLYRIAEMYQWKESKSERRVDKVGGGTQTITEYHYALGWHEALIRSNSFQTPRGHENPESIPFTSQVFDAKEVLLGAFRLDPSQLKQLDTRTDLSLDWFKPDEIPQEISARPLLLRDQLYFPREILRSKGAPEVPVKLTAERPQRPEVGDVRIRYQVVPPQEVTIVAKQSAGTFVEYATKVKARRGINLVAAGKKSSQEMFADARFANVAGLWMMRSFGGFLMFVAVGMFLQPIRALASVIPLLGQIVGWGLALVAFFVSGGLTVMVVGLAWLYYRPIVGLLILLLGAIVIVGVVMLLQMRRSLQESPEMPAPLIGDR